MSAKTNKLPPAVEERLALAARLRAEAEEARGQRGSRPARRQTDVATARASREKRREQFRTLAARGNLPRHRIAELVAAFSQDELADVLAADHAAREAREARAARERERKEVESLALQIEREREAAAREDAHAEAAKRLALER